MQTFVGAILAEGTFVGAIFVGVAECGTLSCGRGLCLCSNPIGVDGRGHILAQGPQLKISSFGKEKEELKK